MTQIVAQQIVVTSGGVKRLAAVQYGQQVPIANRDTTNSFLMKGRPGVAG